MEENQTPQYQIPAVPRELAGKKKSNIISYLIYSIIGIFMLLGTGLAAYFLGFSQGTTMKETCPTCPQVISTPTPSPTPFTSSWLTVSHEKYNFILYYPQNWNVVKDDTLLKATGENSGLDLYLGIDKKYTPTTAQKNSTKEVKQIKLAQLDGSEIDATEYIHEDGKLFLTSTLSSDPAITAWLNADNIDSYEIGKKVLSTFKFQKVTPF